MPSASGSPRSRIATSGLRVPASMTPRATVSGFARRDSPRPRAPRGRSDGSRGRPRRPGPAARCRRAIVAQSRLRSARRRRLLGRQREHEARATAVAILRANRSAMGLDDGAADRETEAHARDDRFRIAARELVEDRTFAPRRQSRAAILDRDFDHAAATRRARCGSAFPAACTWSRSRARFTRTRSISAPSHSDERQVGRQRDLDRASGERGLERGERAADELLERLPVLAHVDAAGFEARHLEQVVDELRGAPRLVADRERLRLAAGGRGSRASSCASVSDSPTSAVSGVRRSCDSADSTELRSRSDSMSTSVRCATVTKCTRSSAIAISAAQVSSSRRCSGIISWPGVGRLDDEHAARAHRRLERQIELAGGGQRVGADAGRLRVVDAPARDRHVDLRCRLSATAGRSVSSSSSISTALLPRARRSDEPLADLARPARARARRRARAPSRTAAARAPRPAMRSAPGSEGARSAAPTTRPTISMTTNVNTYCASLTANVNCGGTKKKSNASTLTTAASDGRVRARTAARRRRRRAGTASRCSSSSNQLLQREGDAASSRRTARARRAYRRHVIGRRLGRGARFRFRSRLARDPADRKTSRSGASALGAQGQAVAASEARGPRRPLVRARACRGCACARTRRARRRDRAPAIVAVCAPSSCASFSVASIDTASRFRQPARAPAFRRRPRASAS